MHAFFLRDDQKRVCFEGKPNKKFLHLEDVKRNNPLDCLKTKDGTECHDMESTLEILHDFYSNLYSSKDKQTSAVDIEAFLNKIESLPCLSFMPELIGPITATEVESAIKRLRLGKAPGSDGLTVDFYKHYSEFLVDVLVDVFNDIYELKDLTTTQKIAIIYSLRDHGYFEWWTFLGDPCSLYADDTAIFLCDLSQLVKVIQHIHWVGTFTGLHLNIDKTIAFNCEIVGERIIARVSTRNTPVKYLGVFLGLGDLTKLNFEQPLRKACGIMNKWNNHHLTLDAHILISKTFLFFCFYTYVKFYLFKCKSD